MHLIITLIFVALYVISVLMAYTGECAYWDELGENKWPNIQTKNAARKDTIKCAVYAAIPIAGFLTAITFTDSFQSGFRWNVRPSSKFGRH